MDFIRITGSRAGCATIQRDELLLLSRLPETGAFTPRKIM
jgi:hypothetical protein